MSRYEFSGVMTVMTFLIRGYQRCISPFLGPRCRFYPSCSQYALEALNIYGVRQGFRKTLVRLCKCHPFHQGGVDLP